MTFFVPINTVFVNWFEEINRHLRNLAPTGLYLSPYDEFRNMLIDKPKEEPEPPMVLTLEHLEIGF